MMIKRCCWAMMTMVAWRKSGLVQQRAAPRFGVVLVDAYHAAVSTHGFISSRQGTYPSHARLFREVGRSVSSAAWSTAATRDSSGSSFTPTYRPCQVINLSAVTQEELQTLLTTWGYPKYRADQVWKWIRVQGVTDVQQMSDLPKKLREQLQEYSKPASLEVAAERTSRDGTIKRAYRCHDGQIIESVLMPYEDGRYTACISSQAGCAQGCVFCATGQMGFARQLSAEEIYEQVARFSALLQQRQHEQVHSIVTAKETPRGGSSGLMSSHGRPTRLSNVVFMGMGEPLANYRNVVEAVKRISVELGIGARRITVSTVGLVPMIRRLMIDLPQVGLAVSLHCATDEERTSLLPANKRYGGLSVLMTTLHEYVETTGRRITLEWALIDGENDGPETAHKLGQLIVKYRLRRDMIHVNVIPLNPTGGYAKRPSNRHRVKTFCSILCDEYGISCTPRVRRGIDIEAGCGQLKASVLQRKPQQVATSANSKCESVVLDSDESSPTRQDRKDKNSAPESHVGRELVFPLPGEAVDFDNDEFDDPEFETPGEKAEADRLIGLVYGTTLPLGIDELPK